jgi:hypothetical protein
MTNPYAVDALVPAASATDVAAWEGRAMLAVWLADEPRWSDTRVADLVGTDV